LPPQPAANGGVRPYVRQEFGDDPQVVVRRHQRHAALLGDPARDGIAIVLQPIIEDYLGTIAARGRNLDRRRVAGHADRRWSAQQPRRQRHALGVVAG